MPTPTGTWTPIAGSGCPTPLEKAREYLHALEADRQAALALSEQKAEGARLIKCRQEGFQAALELLAGAISTDDAEAAPEAPSSYSI